MLAEESGLRGASAPDRRRLRHDGVVQEPLRQRRARQPPAGEAAQSIVTSAAGDDVGDNGQPRVAKAIDVMTRKAGSRFSGGKSYQPRPLSKDIALFIFHHDHFPEPEKIKRVRQGSPSPADPMPQSKITSSKLRGPLASPSWLSDGIGEDGSGGPRHASRPLRTSIFGFAGAARFSDSVDAIRGASVGGAAIAGSGPNAHARPCLKLSRMVLAARDISSDGPLGSPTTLTKVSFGAIQLKVRSRAISELISKRPSVMLHTTLPSITALTVFSCDR